MSLARSLYRFIMSLTLILLEYTWFHAQMICLLHTGGWYVIQNSREKQHRHSDRYFDNAST